MGGILLWHRDYRVSVQRLLSQKSDFEGKKIGHFELNNGINLWILVAEICGESRCQI